MQWSIRLKDPQLILQVEQAQVLGSGQQRVFLHIIWFSCSTEFASQGPAFLQEESSRHKAAVPNFHPTRFQVSRMHRLVDASAVALLLPKLFAHLLAHTPRPENLAGGLTPLLLLLLLCHDCYSDRGRLILELVLMKCFCLMSYHVWRKAQGMGEGRSEASGFRGCFPCF